MKYSFAQRLKQARLNAGLTQKELAEKCGKETSWIGQYECGSKEPGVKCLRELMNALDCDANTLLM